ncbi:hypothetical protein FHT86_007062 [Rhizobium sp. BK313]|nr:hypothetical protein [Rhizobium sp. BK313]
MVEFKSGRRQPKARTNSIWGDTDLKALAREVEDKASPLFSSNEVSGMPDAGGDMLPAPIDVISASENAGDLNDGRTAMFSADGADFDISKQHEADRPAVEAVAEMQESRPALRPQATSRNAARKRAKRFPARAIADISTGGCEDQSTQSETAKDAISFDEVAALDAENRRLKRLLAEQLHAQNLQIKKMLERFDVA